MLPNVTYDDNTQTYSFTLWRDNKKVTHDLKGFLVGLHASPEADVFHAHRVKIDGPAFDGDLHYIFVEDFDGNETFIWVSKNEFELLEAMVDEIKDRIYHDVLTAKCQR